MADVVTPEVAGKVTNVQGEAVAVDPKTGATRVLHPGDPVFIGELIKTAQGAVIDLTLADGRTQEVTSNRKVLLQHDVAAGTGNALTSTDTSVHQNTDVNSILNNAFRTGSSLDSVIQSATFGSGASLASSSGIGNTFHSSGANLTPNAPASVSAVGASSQTTSTILSQTGPGQMTTAASIISAP
ncbi:MAG: hypothetical protein G3I10_03360, partial [Ferrovum sp.]|nr:hypothetical protein [Ferrovum sp.]